MTEKKLILNYEERRAVEVIRKSMMTKPEIVGLLLKDAPHQQAAAVLIQAKDTLNQLLEVNRAFIAAASSLVKKEKPDGQPD